MIQVRPLFKCRMCGAVKHGEIMQLAKRSDVDLLEDVMDFAAPVVEPHDCFPDHSQFGVWEYAGFQKLKSE